MRQLTGRSSNARDWMSRPREELAGIGQSPKASARRASELQYLGDMPWVSRATAMRPDNRYVASGSGPVNTAIQR